MAFTMRNRTAFTLIELLVVVAIIIALLAILLPSMGRAVFTAQLVQCQSNLHQWGISYLSYASDHVGTLPNHPGNQIVNGNPSGVATEFWEVMNKRYGIAYDMAFCPLRTKTPFSNDTLFTASGASWGRYLGYSVWIPRRRGTSLLTPPSYARSVERISEPGEQRLNPLMTDTLLWHNGHTWFDPAWGTAHEYGGKIDSCHRLFLGGDVDSNPGDTIENRFSSHNAQNFY